MNIAKIVAFFCLSLSSICFADEVVLTLETLDGSKSIQLSESQIREQPSNSFSTFDPWDNKQRKYKGCDLSTILAQIVPLDKINAIEVVAKNDYKAIITKTEIGKYTYLLSYEMNDKDYSELGEENKGPLAIAVEMEKVDDYDKVKIKNQLVWWINKIIIK